MNSSDEVSDCISLAFSRGAVRHASGGTSRSKIVDVLLVMVMCVSSQKILVSANTEAMTSRRTKPGSQ
jgi:hypothetical protein